MVFVFLLLLILLSIMIVRSIHAVAKVRVPSIFFYSHIVLYCVNVPQGLYFLILDFKMGPFQFIIFLITPYLSASLFLLPFINSQLVIFSYVSGLGLLLFNTSFPWEIFWPGF